MTAATFLEAFYSSAPDGAVRVSAHQGSRFAKEVAGDYNYLHDPDSRRFCVPGDLLASLVLDQYGLSAHMRFVFRGMVGAEVPLYFPAEAGSAFDVTDADGKVFLHVEREGDTLTDPAAVEGFIREYVAFSGQTFPHYLDPLLAEHGVMFNPDRPLVMYDRMELDLTDLHVGEPALAFDGGALDASSKRADVAVRFAVHSGGRTVGSGAKHLVISGLRPYDEARMQAFIESFNQRKAAFERARGAG